ncbi:hypothetical protein [Streptobacillus moniliformis]|uniref:hypothetical protein n=1 Tax=Streptobacillus moniliformis TaxID=34105 RepID=UPI0007E3AEF3|nr:hypothetical protein [Streptobacillus moniliformis]
MKKGILFMVMSSFTIFASDMTFDLENSKPFGGEVETNFTVSSEMSKQDKSDFLLKHNLGVKAEVYELITLGGKIGYGYKNTVKQVYLDVENTELNANVNLRKYGNLGFGYKFGGNYGSELEIKYANKDRINSATIGGYMSYKRIFTPSVKIADTNFIASGMRVGDGEIYVSHDVNKNLRLTYKAGVNVNVDTQKLFMTGTLKKNAIEADMKIGGKIDVSISPKVTFSSYNELGVVVNKINLNMADISNSSTSLRFETDNKVKIITKRGVLITPKMALSADRLETKLNTNLRADYNIIGGLSVNGGVGVENKFKYVSGKTLKEYESTTPYAKGGLLYKW